MSNSIYEKYGYVPKQQGSQNSQMATERYDNPANANANIYEKYGYTPNVATKEPAKNQTNADTSYLDGMLGLNTQPTVPQNVLDAQNTIKRLESLNQAAWMPEEGIAYSDAKKTLAKWEVEQQNAATSNKERDNLIKQMEDLEAWQNSGQHDNVQWNEIQRQKDAVSEKLAALDEQLGNNQRYYDQWSRTKAFGNQLVKGGLADTANAIATAGAWGAKEMAEDPSLYGAFNVVDDQFYKQLDDERKTRRDMQTWSDKTSEQVGADYQKAKTGLSAEQQFGMDLALAGGQLAGDMVLGMIPGVGTALSTTALGLRAGGGAAREARQAGATIDQQMAYGLASAGVEILTEKIADGVAGVYGKGGADDMAQDIIRKLAKTDNGRTVLNILYGMGSEGMEEAISELVNPALKMVYDSGKSAQYSYLTEEGRKELGSDMATSALIGSILGGFGGGVSLANGQNAQTLAGMRVGDQLDANKAERDRVIAQREQYLKEQAEYEQKEADWRHGKATAGEKFEVPESHKKNVDEVYPMPTAPTTRTEYDKAREDAIATQKAADERAKRNADVADKLREIIAAKRNRKVDDINSKREDYLLEQEYYRLMVEGGAIDAIPESHTRPVDEVYPLPKYSSSSASQQQASQKTTEASQMQGNIPATPSTPNAATGQAQELNSAPNANENPDITRYQRKTNEYGFNVRTDEAFDANTNEETSRSGDLKTESTRFSVSKDDKALKNAASNVTLKGNNSALQTAIKMAEKGESPSKVFSETGLVVMANGDIADGFGGEVIWRRGREGAEGENIQNNNEVSERRSDTSDERMVRKTGGGSGEDVFRGTGRKTRAELGSNEWKSARGAILKTIEALNSREAKLLLRGADIEKLAETIYADYVGGNALLEQWSALFDTNELANKLDDILNAKEILRMEVQRGREEDRAFKPGVSELVEDSDAARNTGTDRRKEPASERGTEPPLQEYEQRRTEEARRGQEIRERNSVSIHRTDKKRLKDGREGISIGGKAESGLTFQEGSYKITNPNAQDKTVLRWGRKYANCVIELFSGEAVSTDGSFVYGYYNTYPKEIWVNVDVEHYHRVLAHEVLHENFASKDADYFYDSYAKFTKNLSVEQQKMLEEIEDFWIPFYADHYRDTLEETLRNRGLSDSEISNMLTELDEDGTFEQMATEEVLIKAATSSKDFEPEFFELSNIAKKALVDVGVVPKDFFTSLESLDGINKTRSVSGADILIEASEGKPMNNKQEDKPTETATDVQDSFVPAEDSDFEEGNEPFDFGEEDANDNEPPKEPEKHLTPKEQAEQDFGFMAEKMFEVGERVDNTKMFTAEKKFVNLLGKEKALEAAQKTGQLSKVVSDFCNGHADIKQVADYFQKIKADEDMRIFWSNSIEYRLNKAVEAWEATESGSTKWEQNRYAYAAKSAVDAIINRMDAANTAMNNRVLVAESLKGKKPSKTRAGQIYQKLQLSGPNIFMAIDGFKDAGGIGYAIAEAAKDVAAVETIEKVNGNSFFSGFNLKDKATKSFFNGKAMTGVKVGGIELNQQQAVTAIQMFMTMKHMDNARFTQDIRLNIKGFDQTLRFKAKNTGTNLRPAVADIKRQIDRLLDSDRDIPDYLYNSSLNKGKFWFNFQEGADKRAALKELSNELGVLLEKSKFDGLEGFKFGREENAPEYFFDREDVEAEFKALADKLEAALDPVAKEYVKAMDDMFSHYAPMLKETASENSSYINLFPNGKYFPLSFAQSSKAAADYSLANELENSDADGTLYGPGITHSRDQYSGEMLVIEPVTEVVNRYINQASRYISHANFAQVLELMNLDSGLVPSISEAVGKSFGVDFEGWMNKYIDDVKVVKDRKSRDEANGIMDYLNPKLRKARQNLQQGALLFSPSTPLKQGAAYFSAGGVLRVTSLAKAWNFNPVKGRGESKGNALAEGRKLGGLDPTLNELLHESDTWLGKLRSADNKAGRFVNWAANTIASRDAKIIDDLYHACVIDAYADYKEQGRKVDKNSAEFKKLVEQKFEQVLLTAQSTNSDTLSSELQRTDNELLKCLSMFRSQQTQEFNKLVTAFGEFRAAKGTSKETEAKRTLTNAVVGQSMAALHFSLLTAAVNVLLHKLDRYEDEDEKIDPNKLMSGVAIDTLENLAGVAWLGEAAAQYLIEFASGGEINEFYGIPLGPIDTVQSIFDSLGYFRQKPNIVNAKKLAGNIATAFGVPMNNVYNVINAATMWMLDFTGSNPGDYDDVLKFLQSKSKEKSSIEDTFKYLGLSADNKSEVIKVYEATERDGIVPTNFYDVDDISYDGISYELEKEDVVSASAAYSEAYTDYIDVLLSSSFYKDASTYDKGKMLQDAEKFAYDTAKEEVVESRDVDYRSTYAEMREDYGDKAAQYASFTSAYDIAKDSDNYDAIDALISASKRLPMSLREDFKEEVGEKKYDAIAGGVGSETYEKFTEKKSDGYSGIEALVSIAMTNKERSYLAENELNETSRFIYNAATSHGYSSRDIPELVDTLTGGDDSLSQADLVAAYEANPSLEPIIAQVWASKGWKTTWEKAKR